jgi:hypothetical protein
MPRELLPFVVETGAGLTNATSYASVEFADEYLDRILDTYKSVWLASDIYQKQQSLVYGTQLIDDYIYFPNTTYQSIRTSQYQALHFPRSGMVDYDGYTIPNNSVPVFIQRAATQMGFELFKADRTTEPTRGIVSATVGPLSVTFDQNYSHQTRVIPRSVSSIVAPYGGVVRGQSGIKSVPLFRA